MTRRLLWSKREPGKSSLQRTRASRSDGKAPLARVKPGDRLWVRESFFLADHYLKVAKKFTGGCYKADETSAQCLKYTGWRSPIFMPRWASRLTLIVTATKIERLQEISKRDVIAEGVTERDGAPIADVHAGWHEPFAALWIALHGPDAWDTNPEVVAITFKCIKANIDAPEAKAA